MSKTDTEQTARTAEAINSIPDPDMRDNFMKIYAAAVELSTIMATPTSKAS